MEEGEQMEAFLRWAAIQGITDCPNQPLQPSPSSPLAHSLFISHFPDAGGRGLAAVRELRKGELILRVPRPALFTSESVLSKDKKLAFWVNRNAHLSSTQVLAACLLTEVGRGRASWWYPYLVLLPRSYSTLSSFTRFEIQAMQVDDAIWASEKAVSKARLDWEKASALMKELELKPQLLTFRSWLWASATISSRALHIPWDDAGCLCPVGDLFNYAAPEEEDCTEDIESTEGASSLKISSVWKDKDSTEKPDAGKIDRHSQRLVDGGYEEDVSAYCFYARKRYRKGEQVLLCYGTYTNLELLEHYGFLLNTNPNDKAFIQLDMDLSSSNPWPKDSQYIQQDGRLSFAFLSALRLSATDPNLRKAVGRFVYSGSVLSAENEISVMKPVAKKCHDLLEEMPTSFEEDCLLLRRIEKLLGHPFLEEATETVACEVQLCDFFQVNGLQKEVVSNLPLPGKAKRSMERWKLAVEWRFRYKQILSNCISYCTNMIEHFSSGHVSGKRTNQA